MDLTLKEKIINKKEIIYNILFYSLFIIVCAILFAKCKYGYADIDETYYIQIAHRIAQGDALITEEWHICQLFSYLLFPIVRLYMLFTNSFEGIVLAFRYIYTFVWGISSLFIYYEVKKFTKLGAIFSSLFFLIYAPFGIMALSYNTFGILFLTLSCVMNLSNNSPLRSIISGSFYAFSVLCCPTLALLLIFYFIYYLIIKKDKKQLLFFLLGILIQIIVFTVFVLSRTSISKIMKSIPYILGDSEHNGINIIDKINSWFLAFYSNGNIYFILIIGLVTIVSYFSRHKNIYFITLIAIILILVNKMYSTHYYINFIVYPLAFIAPFLFQINNIKIKNILYSVWIPGVIYSFCINIISNQVEYAIFSALSIASFACISCIFIYIEDMNINNKTYSIFLRLFVCFAILLQIYLELNVRWHPIFWDTYVSQQTILIDKGPEKGIYVSEKKKEIYDYVMNASSKLDLKGKSVLFLTNDSLYYLIHNELRSSSYSSWVIPDNDYQDKYFGINPQKLPDYIFYPLNENTKYEDVINHISEKYNYIILSENNSGILYKINH